MAAARMSGQKASQLYTKKFWLINFRCTDSFGMIQQHSRTVFRSLLYRTEIQSLYLSLRRAERTAGMSPWL